nr:MAG: hypothetical protein [Guiyang fiers-like virus 4]
MTFVVTRRFGPKSGTFRPTKLAVMTNWLSLLTTLLSRLLFKEIGKALNSITVGLGPSSRMSPKSLRR